MSSGSPDGVRSPVRQEVEVSTTGYGESTVRYLPSHETRSGDSRTLNEQPSGRPLDIENGPGEAQSKTQRKLGVYRRRQIAPLPFKERALRITWAWFPTTMSTGAMASLIAVQPFTFAGLRTIGKIFYIVDLVLFVLFTILIIIRFCFKPRAITTSLHHQSESFFFGSFWVSIALIINGAAAYGVPDSGSWLLPALRVVFWIYMACALLVAVFEYHVIFEVEKLSLSEAVPGWILPAYPFLVSGTIAANIAKTQSSESGLQIIIGGLMGQGLGFFLALCIYVVYITRLMANNMPEPPTRPGMYISVGPTSYTCAGLVALGVQAQTFVPEGFLGVNSLSVGDVWRACSVAAGLFLWLTAVWFASLTTLSNLLVIKQMRFTLQWWALVFPNAGLAIATIQIGNALDSHGLRVFASVLTVILVALWLVIAAFHIRAVWRRDLLAVGKDMGVEEVNKRHDEKKAAGKWTDGETRKRGAKQQSEDDRE